MRRIYAALVKIHTEASMIADRKGWVAKTFKSWIKARLIPSIPRTEEQEEHWFLELELELERSSTK